MEADHDGDGKLSFEEFTEVVAKTVCLISSPFSPPFTQSYITSYLPGYRETDDARALILDGQGPFEFVVRWTILISLSCRHTMHVYLLLLSQWATYSVLYNLLHAIYLPCGL